MVPTPTFSNPAAAAGGNSNTNEKETNGNAYEEALSRLRPLQPVLWGFNHRNRNQHRRAAWWGAFGMLRRRVDKVVEELASTAALFINTSKSISVAKSKKRKRIEEEQQEREEKVRGHVRWLRDVLVPKCYLAFSQLTADNQFATLGVVLLGALAQVNAACAGLIGDGAPPGQDTDASALGLAISNSTSVGGPSNPGDTKPLVARVRSDRAPGDEGPGQGGGTVISRDEVARAEKLRRKKQKLEGDSGSRLESPSTSDPTKEDRKRGGGDIASKAKAKEVKNALGKEDLKPVKKKKKTKKGGDEFDDLFKGLF